MHPLLPTIGPLERTLALRSLPILHGLRSGEVALLAQQMREDYVRHGTILQRAGAPVDAVTVISEGVLRRECDGRIVDAVEAPDAVGLIECLAGANATASTIAGTNAVALTIDRGVLFDVLEEQFTLLQSIRRALGEQIDALQRELGAFAVPVATAPATAATAAPPLDLIGRLLWLQSAPVLDGFGVAVQASLVRDAVELRAQPGEGLCRAGDDADRFALVVEGDLTCTPVANRQAFKLGAGALVGLDAVLAGVPYPYSAVADTPVVAVPISARLFWDIAEDHFHVAIRALAACARRLLDLTLQRDESVARHRTEDACTSPV